MIPISAFQFGIPVAIFLIAAVMAFLRSDLTRYHIPVIMLALFALTSGLMIPVGAELIRTDAERIDYRVTSQQGSCNATADEQVTRFDSLSTEAQDVFLSTLQSDEEYTTTVHPDEYELSTDVGAQNYIIYESDCYSLVGSSRGGLHYGILLHVLPIVGIPIAIGLATLAGFSYRYRNFRIPVTVVSGITTAIGLYTLVGLRTLLPISFLLAATVWIILKDFEPLKG